MMLFSSGKVKCYVSTHHVHVYMKMISIDVMVMVDGILVCDREYSHG